MKNRIFTILMVSLLCYLGSKGQTYPLVTIHDIQYMPADTLNNCHFVCKYNNDTVRVRGICVMKGNQSTAYNSNNKPTTREVYLQDGSGPNSGIDVFTLNGGTVTSPQDIFSLIPGDSIEVTGLISVYAGQVEIEPVIKTAGGAKYTENVKYLGVSKYGPKYTTVPLSQMVNSKSVNHLSTGEQWESVYINLQNVQVNSVSTANGRTSFTVADSAGDLMTVYDRFYIQRDGINGNTFKLPHVGDQFKSLKGVISGYASPAPSCTNGTYELYPFDSTDYVYSLSAPIINFVTRSPLVPESSNSVTITVNVTPFGSRGIKNVTLYYKTGNDTSIFTGYTSVNMTQSGANYVATIPSEANGTAVKYWVTAVDTISQSPLRSYSPNVKAPNISPYFYTVRDGGLTIYDVQYRPLPAAPSAYINDTVTVSGVVTASLADLGYFYIQQPGLNAWAGLNLTSSLLLANFNTGDYVTVTGVVSENSGYTSLVVANISKAAGSFQISPISVLDTLLTGGNLNQRQYMSMLTTLKPASGGKMKVIQKNADPTYANGGFGDFRVGENTAKPLVGTRVTCGNYSSGDPSSENVSYVNDSSLGIHLKVSKWRVIEVGDNMDSITGIMFYNFSNYKLLPRTNADIHGINNSVVSTHTSGIENQASTGASINVYPNPANGNFHIELNNHADPGLITIRIIDLTGRTVYDENIPGETVHHDINLENVKQGAYMMTLTSSNGIIGQTKLLICK